MERKSIDFVPSLREGIDGVVRCQKDKQKWIKNSSKMPERIVFYGGSMGWLKWVE